MSTINDESFPPTKRLKTASSPSDQRCSTEVSEQDLSPIHPTIVTHTGLWKVSSDENKSILYRVPVSFSSFETNVTVKVLGLNLNGTIYDSALQYPQALEDFELYNQNVISKLKEAHDDSYTLILFINDGRIRSNSQGKSAGKLKNLVEFIADRLSDSIPLFAFVSTMTKSGMHKPNPRLWREAQNILNVEFDNKTSLFVGGKINIEKPVDDTSDNDSDCHEIQIIKGDDEEFARLLGIKFQTPWSFFGKSTKNVRMEQKEQMMNSIMLPYIKPPDYALEHRCALRSQLLEGPLLLLLVGSQGSGKSFFANDLVSKSTPCHWKHFSQDTIRNGSSGTRQAVEDATRIALRSGYSVVVDRMHLDEGQRAYFVQIAKALNVPVHALVFKTSKSKIQQRVETRSNHAVMGKKGAILASQSYDRLSMPGYDEGFHLISCTKSEEGVSRFVNLYRRVFSPQVEIVEEDKIDFLPNFNLEGKIQFPMLSLGTYEMKKNITEKAVGSAILLGFEAIDTAPTYNNEKEIGQQLQLKENIKCIVKIPKRATSREQVLLELKSSLEKLGRKTADLLLLHWPSDVFAKDKVEEVWNAMEECVESGQARALGVCNFNIDALRFLLTKCKRILPAVNQVERHPHLPQWELIDFCDQNDIILQAYSPLGR